MDMILPWLLKVACNQIVVGTQRSGADRADPWVLVICWIAILAAKHVRDRVLRSPLRATTSARPAAPAGEDVTMNRLAPLQ
jgi:hypothetical protein